MSTVSVELIFAWMVPTHSREWPKFFDQWHRQRLPMTLMPTLTGSGAPLPAGGSPMPDFRMRRGAWPWLLALNQPDDPWNAWGSLRWNRNCISYLQTRRRPGWGPGLLKRSVDGNHA